MEEEKKINYAAIARAHNINYSMLYKKVHSGIPLEDAVAACERTRDARLVSGKLRAPSSSLVPITFDGTTYPSFAAACRACSLSEQTAYVQRKRIMDKESISEQEASQRVLQAAVAHPPKQRAKKPVTVFGITYDSLAQAAQVLNIPVGSIASKRVREHLSAENAIIALLSQQQGDASLTRVFHSPGRIWEELKTSLLTYIPNSREDNDILTTVYRIADEAEVFCRISMPLPQYLNFHFSDLDFISAQDVNALSAAYCGIKFIINEYDQVDALSDVFLSGYIRTDTALVQNMWRHCCVILSKLYSDTRKF